MSKIDGGLGTCFDCVRSALPGEGLEVYHEAARALDSIEEAFMRRVKWAHDARGLAQRLTGMLELQIKWLRDRATEDEAPDEEELKARGDELETQLLRELGYWALDKMPPKALVELGVAIAAELERRGITAFPVTLGGDGKIQGPGGHDCEGC